MIKIVFASRNRGKIREMNKLFDRFLGEGEVELLSLDDIGFEGDIVEDGKTFAENAMIKARAAADFSGMAALADDSGLCVEALDGAPGIYSARYAGEGHDDEANNALLLENLKGVADRAAYFICTLACVFPEGTELDGEPIEVSGYCAGEILCAPRGKNGFGYDPLFWIDELGRTLAELSEDEKNMISHRAAAVYQLSLMLRPRIEFRKKVLAAAMELLKKQKKDN